MNLRDLPEHIADASAAAADWLTSVAAYVFYFGSFVVAIYLFVTLPADDSIPGYSRACSPEYTYVCIHQTKEDWNCDELSEWDFKSVGTDPYRLDPDSDGIACESP